MLQIEGNTRWERFLSAVKGLNLRFEHAEIVKKTGYSKSVVSSYMNIEGGKEPSENFIRTFCDRFDINFDDIWLGSPETNGRIAESQKQQPAESKDQTVAKLAQALADQAEANKIQAAANDKYADGFRSLSIVLERMESKMARQDSQTIIVDAVKRIETSLTETLTGVEWLSKIQVQEIADLLKELRAQKKGPSQGAHKKSDETDGDGHKSGMKP